MSTSVPYQFDTLPIAFIGGSSFLESSYLASFQILTITTPYGAANIYCNDNRTIYYVQRHATNPVHPYSPPHLINHRANISALQQCGVRSIIAFGSVGSLKKSLPVSSLVIPDDFFDPTPISLFEYDKRGHLGPSFHAALRQKLIDILRPHFPALITHSTYAQTHGPRFETPAEIRHLAMIGDVVGMTCATEASLAQELSIPYATVCMVDNMANGLADQSITYEEFHAGVKRNLATMENVLKILLEPFHNAQIQAANGHSNGVTKVVADAIYHAEFIVPVIPETLLRKHALVIKDGKILDLLPSSEVESKYTAVHIENFGNRALLPGLVNAHTHVGMTLLRGFADDLQLHEWLTDHIWPTEHQFVSDSFVRASTQLALAEMIRGGVTTFNDMYWFPETIAKCTSDAGMRAILGLIMLDFPSAWAKTSDEYFAKGLQLRAQYADSSLIGFSVAPHAPYTVCDENLSRCKQLARNAETGGHRIHTHLHETFVEVEASVKNIVGPNRHRSDHNMRPLHNLHRLGLVDENLIAVHMTQLDTDDIQLLAKTKAHVVHCPTSNLKLASGTCPVEALVSAGVNVALGTDSTASNNKLDMWGEVRLAAILAKNSSQKPTAVPATQAIRLATINGARALGLESKIGSLEIGKCADFIAVQLDDLELLPLFDIASHLVYSMDRQQVTDVWVNGRRLLAARRLTTLNETEIKTNVLSWQSKLLDFHDHLATMRSKADAPVTEPAAPILEVPASEVVDVSANHSDTHMQG